MHPTSYYHHLLLLLLLLFNIDAVVIGDDVVDEQHALLAFRQAFPSLIHEGSWNGPHCSVNSSAWRGIRCINNRVVAISLPDFGLSGQLDDPIVLASLTKLAVLSLRNNSIYGAMLDFSFNLKLTSIDFSMNKLSGPISNTLIYLNSLESLQLDHNMLNGTIPPLNQSSLKVLNLSYNNLTGEIPPTITLQAFTMSSYLGNPDLCGNPSPISCSVTPVPYHAQSTKREIFVLRAITAACGILAIFGLILLIRRIYVDCTKPKEREVVKEKSFELDFFTLEEINRDDSASEEKRELAEEETRKITSSEEKREVVREEKRKITFVRGGGGFDLESILKSTAEGLGKGGFGSCYKAVFEGRSIVVKRLRELSPLSSEEFSKQMRDLGAMDHPNLLPLLGYYNSEDEKLLFHDFARNGNLFDRIHGEKKPHRIPFKWSSRLLVAWGVARAMEYLHLINAKGSTAIPHGNLKSSNVLLDENDMALVCDYGFLSLVSPSLAVQRMVSYKAPEYEHHRQISSKTDVWCYGCLLLELLTGKVSAYSAPPGIAGVKLCNWVHRAVREEWTAELFDAEIVERGAGQGMIKLLKIALWCIEIAPDTRPEMGEVAREVEGITVSDLDAEED